MDWALALDVLPSGSQIAKGVILSSWVLSARVLSRLCAKRACRLALHALVYCGAMLMFFFADMGIWHVALVLPRVISPLISGFILRIYAHDKQKVLHCNTQQQQQ